VSYAEIAKELDTIVKKYTANSMSMAPMVRSCRLDDFCDIRGKYLARLVAVSLKLDTEVSSKANA
jgi:hypothetical protein